MAGRRHPLAGALRPFRKVVAGLPRPRWDYDVRAHPDFTRIRAELWSALRGDLIAGNVDGAPS